MPAAKIYVKPKQSRDPIASATPAGRPDPKLFAASASVLSHFQKALADSLSDCKGLRPSDLASHAASLRLFENTSLEAEVLRTVIDELTKRERGGVEKEKILEQRLQKQRPAVLRENVILNDIVRARDKAKREYDERQLDGVDLDNYLDWKVTIWEALGATTLIMMRMLSLVALFATSAFLVVKTVELTLVGGRKGEKVGGGAEKDEGADGNSKVALLLFLWSAGSSTILHCFVAFGVNLRYLRSYAAAIAPFVAMLAVLLGAMRGGTRNIDSIPLSFSYIFVASLNAGGVGYAFFTEKDRDDGKSPLFLAATKAKHAMDGTVFRPKSRKGRIKAGAALIIPNLFVYATLMFLILVIFWAFQATDIMWVKVLVVFVAFIIKVVGNKLFLGLLRRLVMWVVDGELYLYEYSTALLLRILQLSIPDEHTATVVGLVSALGEVCVRVFFYVMFCKAALKNNHMNDKEKRRHAAWGKLRVQDSSNDMVVEYMSSISAGLFLIYLSPLKWFTFASKDRISDTLVIKLCSYQMLPELVLDFYCTFMEVYGGLKAMHLSYWRSKTGADEKSRHWIERVGDFPKVIFVKFWITASTTAFVLAVALKSGQLEHVT
jgi:hypothetical protein